MEREDQVLGEKEREDGLIKSWPHSAFHYSSPRQISTHIIIRQAANRRSPSTKSTGGKEFCEGIFL